MADPHAGRYQDRRDYNSECGQQQRAGLVLQERGGRRVRRWCGWWRVERSDEPVAAAGDGLDEAGIVGRVTKGGAEFADRDINGVVEVAEALVGPDAGAQLFATDQRAGALQQELQDLEGLILELDATSGFTDLSGVEIGLKGSETNRAISVGSLHYPVFRKVQHRG
jgi:hypothetical protein